MDLLYLTSFIKIAKDNWIVNIFWEVLENGYLDITVVWHESGNLAKFDIFNLDSFRFVISPVRFLTIGKLDFPQVRERICPIMAAVRKWEVQTELSRLPNHLQLTPRDGWISSLETFRCNKRTHLICFLLPTFISSVRSSYSHPDLLLIHHHHHPTFSDHTGPQHWTFTFWATTAI